MRAFIFAAGLGTRLRPLTDTLPKALVPLCGKPLLEHLLLKLRAAGCTDAVINIHHFAGRIRAFVEENPVPGMRIRFSDETDLLRETGGGIRHAAPLLEGEQDPFLIHNVDIVSDLDVAEFYRSHRSDALATILVSRRETSRYLLFGREGRLAAWTDIRTGEVKSPYPELRRSPEQGENLHPEACGREPLARFCAGYGLEAYAFAGIHVLSPAVFPLMASWPEKFSIIDFYLSVADRYPVYARPADRLRLIDVGKAESLRRAEEEFRTLL